MNNLALAIFYLVVLAGYVWGSDWTYDEGEKWAPLCLSGKAQSPIALTESIATEKEFHPFTMTGYGQIGTALLKNNGHSAEVRMKDIEQPTVRGGGLPGTYKLDHLHFHWQSEHTMSNYRFPLEVHFVHYNEREAVQHSHGLAVLGVMFDLSPDDDEDSQPLIDVVEVLKEIPGEVKHLENFSPKHFLPRDKAGFYRYHGSLTTPGCNEGVVWTVFTNTLPISVKQVKTFESFLTHEKTQLIKNYRPLQELNGRKVYLKVSPVKENGVSKQRMSVTLIIVTSLYFVFSNLL